MARFIERETEILVEDKDAENTGVPQGKESFKTRIKDSVSARFKSVLRCCVLHCCFVFYLRLSMYNLKTIIKFGFS